MIDRTLSEAVLTSLRDVAESLVRPRFRALRSDEVFDKGGDDPVTVADREAERALAEALVPLISGCTVVGEEMTHADPSLLRRLKEPAPVWILDPIDGTRSFIKGKDNYCMIVALMQGGVTRGAWIFAPEYDEAYTAVLGEGAFLNGEPLPLRSEQGTDDPFTIAADPGLMSEEARTVLGTRFGRPFERVGLFSAGLVYCNVARGRLAGTFFRSCKPWDHAAGCLLVAEAGGGSVYLDGTAYDPVADRKGILTLGAPLEAREVASLLQPLEAERIRRKAASKKS
ncbi:MAG: inositol monophosphatase family protein [Pseudomonadota bacterium]